MNTIQDNRCAKLYLLKEAYQLEEELWKDIEGYQEPYEISSLGRVRNKNTQHILKTSSRGENQRDSISLTKNGDRKHVNIHRLVAEAFVPNPDNLPQVDHIDRDIHNNKASNLRWVTPSQNCQNRNNIALSHNFDNGRIYRKVIRYNPETQEKTVFNSIREAVQALNPIDEKDFHTKAVNISACLHNKQRVCCGYLWFPIDE